MFCFTKKSCHEAEKWHHRGHELRAVPQSRGAAARHVPNTAAVPRREAEAGEWWENEYGIHPQYNGLIIIKTPLNAIFDHLLTMNH